VTARHAVRQHSAATTTGLLAAVIGAAAGVQGAGDLANVAGTALVRGYGREHELESDRLGAEYLARAGYDPRAMLDVIGVLKDQESFELQQAEEEGREPRIYHGLFSTHPANDRRLQETVLAAQQFQGQNGALANREGFIRQMDGLTFGDSEREGVLRGDRFYHKPLNFGLQFPAGWKVKNLPNALVAQAPDGNGVLEVEVQDLNRRLSPREFMTVRLGIQEMRSEEALDVAGLPGYTAEVPATTRDGKRWIRVAVLHYHDQAFIFSGYYPRAEPEQHAVLSTARSFHALSAEEQVLATAQRIRLTRAEADTSYAALARRSPIQHHAEDQLRLLNDQYPEGEPAPGQWLKIVE
jgi:predicted Zn-dependent protease